MSTTTADSAPTVVRTQRVFPHSPEAVYAAFADGERLARWWGPRGFTNTFETFEFRPGGGWVFVMHGPDGGHHPNESIFRACDPDRRVQIEHLSPPHFTLTVTLELDAKGTKLTWAQSFPRSRGRRAGRGDRRARERGESGSVECGVERALSGPRSVCRLSATRLSSSLGTNRETPLLLGRCALRGDA